MAHVVVVDALGCNHALVSESGTSRKRIRAWPSRSGVDAFRKADLVPLAGAKVEHAGMIEGRRFLGGHEVVLKQLHAFRSTSARCGQQLFPVGRRWVRHRRGHQAEVLGLAVGAQIEEAVAMLDAVLVPLFAGQHGLETSPPADRSFRNRVSQVSVLADRRNSIFLSLLRPRRIVNSRSFSW